MEIRTLKDLDALLKLCRKRGVTEIDLGTVKFTLGEVSPDLRSGPPAEEHDPTDPYANFPVGELTPEQLMFYSAGGLPEDDPELQKGKDS